MIWGMRLAYCVVLGAAVVVVVGLGAVVDVCHLWQPFVAGVGVAVRGSSRQCGLLRPH